MPITISAWQTLPNGKHSKRRLFAIGDIHAAIMPLQNMQAHLAQYIGAGSGDLLVYLGDYIDRGPEPIAAMQAVQQGLNLRGLEEIKLRGNHDQYLIDAAQLSYNIMDLEQLSNWLRWGGASTLDAMKIPDDAIGDRLAQYLRECLGKPLQQFLIDLPTRHDVENFTFVHAGLDPELPFNDQDEYGMRSIRKRFLEAKSWPFSNMVVHGHSVQTPAIHAHRIGVDIGVFKNSKLAAVEISGRQARFHIYSPE